MMVIHSFSILEEFTCLLEDRESIPVFASYLILFSCPYHFEKEAL